MHDLICLTLVVSFLGASALYLRVARYLKDEQKS